MNILAVYSMKGGVGKTATAVNLAYLAAASGLRTLLIDLDPQGASSYYFRVKPAKKQWGKRFFSAYETLLEQIKASDYEGLDILPAHLSFRHFDTVLMQLKKRKTRLKKLLNGLASDYDLILLDCPPGIGQLAEAVIVAADRLLVPVIPTTLSERTWMQLLDFLQQKNHDTDKLLPFFSMVQAQKSLHGKTQQDLRERFVGFLNTSIPFAADIENMGETRAPVAIYAARRPAAKAYESLWQEVAQTLD